LTDDVDTTTNTDGKAAADDGSDSKDPITSIKDTSSDGKSEEEEGVLARLRTEAARRLKDFEKAEDAADEALLRFGTNIANFLKDAVTIAPPSDSEEGTANGNGDSIVFESKGLDGKPVIHTTRLDAQLYHVHNKIESFTKDPDSEKYAEWKKDFKVDEKTEEIGNDLETYPELRSAMEKVVPDTVPYGDFWTRYYFLRHVIDMGEQKRKELLKGMFMVCYLTIQCP
jgi:hypothetical protein